jgi:cobalt transporter subunit CbtB
VEDAWGIKMQTEATRQTDTLAALTLVRAIPIFAAALLGLFIVGGVGFSHIEAVHNAAHDYRHSMSFPCH